MSGENLEIVRRWSEAVNRRDLDTSTFEGGKLSGLHTYESEAEALEAVGLRE
jgi:hypothetical protein